MAQLKDLIVNGPSRFIGDVCATTFTGNLAGNANTATNATNAGMIAGLSVHSGRNNEANKIVRTDGNGYLQVGYINSSSGHEKNASNPTYVWGSNSSDSYLRSYQTSSLSVKYATSSGSCSGNAATATKASYLDTGGMALYANNNNEINFGGTNTSSIIFFGYRATGSKPIPTSFIFGGSGGTATLTADGFKKKDSSASYVLTGDGGHAAISSLSVNYANSSGSCSGNAATATNASSASNADKLDGVHYQNILERQCSGSGSSGTATGWFRIAETLINNGGGITFLLAIQRTFHYTNNESYLFSISVSFGGGISITQLSGYANIRLITKIRVDWANSQIAYIDLYIDTSYTTNNYYWYTVGCAKSYTTWTANPTLVGNTYEFTTVQGCKSDRGFTGYLTGNATSSSKWATPRTITLTGSVTGSVSIDGSANVTLATTTNHTHNYAGSSSAGGSANSALTLLYNNILDTNYGNYAVFQQFAGLSDFPHSGWFNSIKMLHNNSYGYFTEIAMSFTGEDGMWRRALRGGTQVGWYKMLDSGNYNSYALPISGGTLTGSVIMRGIDTNLIRDIVFDGTGGWARGLITLRVDGVDKFNIGAYGGYTVGASNNGIYYGYIGCNSYDGLNLRISATSLSWGDNSILHTGNYNSYSPKLDGTGASGTWGINISGNAATATNADLLDGYHKNDIIRKTTEPTSVISLNNVVTEGIDFTSWGYAHSANINNQPGGDGASSAACVVSFGTDFPFQIYSDYNNTSLLYYRSYYSNIGWKAWRQFAFIDSNVASATKLQNSRTIWGHNFDGTGNVSGALSGVTTINSTLYIDLSGNIGIGTASPSYKLYVNGDGYFTENIITESDFKSLGDAIIDGYVGIGTQKPAYRLDVNGTISCTKLLQTSDIKYKTNIKQIEYEEALKIIENLNPVTWDWNENTVEIGSSSGFVAQEAEEFIPNAISRDNENNLSLDYTQLHSYEIKVIQEQQKEIIKLKEKLKILEKLIS